jgi:prepilin-type N-terminal cleavage/methylation domain-containing protein
MNRQKAFTLLEILVVLALTGLTAGILLQGIQQVFFLQRHFGVEFFQSQQGLMRAEWFRDCINGLVPEFVDGQHKFRGSERRLQGLTTMPLDAPEGALSGFELSIDFDAKTGEAGLYYGNITGQQLMLSWPGSMGRFAYIDTDGLRHSEWPPFLGKWPQLPKVIELETGQKGERQILIAAPMGLTKPLPSQKDVLGD